MSHRRIFTLLLTISLALIGVSAPVLAAPRSQFAHNQAPFKQEPDLRTAPAQPILTPANVDITIDEIVASGFNRPVQLTHAGDGSGRLFVVEQNGQIRIIANGVVLATPFLDIGGLVLCCGEQGLLGLAFHPNYTQNGYFYINYTRYWDGATVITRYNVSAGDPNLADPGSAMVLLTIAQPYGNHNGGQLLFSPVDGYLYIGMGDGGSGGDPLNHSQNIETLLGAMLRLDVDGGAPYAVPPDNPYVGGAGLDEIWAIGLRNPWRFSFDRQSGDLYIGDVGQNLWEEISYQAANTPGGTNFGWRCMEGNHTYNFSGECPNRVLTGPIAEYPHGEGYSVTGGFVYRGPTYLNLVGRYFYADYSLGKIWSMYKTGTNPDTWSTPELELDSGILISAFGEDEQGEVFVVDYGGSIRRLADLNGPTLNLSNSKKLVSTPSADAGEVVGYTINLINSGSLADLPVVITDTIPVGLDYVPNSLQASHGGVDDSLAPTLRWQGNLNASLNITLTYQVTVSGAVTGSLVNQAILTGAPGWPLTLSASLSTPRSPLTTTAEDFFFPGSQPGSLSAELTPSADCDICHNEPIYDRWRGSMMSQAGRDPLLWAALHVANIDTPGAGEYCLRCHTPKGWLEGRSQPADGSALQAGDIANGVTCTLCHRMVDPLPSTMDEAAAIDHVIRNSLPDPLPAGFVGSSALIVDPQDRRRGPFSFGLALPYHSAYQTDLLRQSGDAVTRSRLCGSCHNVYNPVLSWDPGRDQFWPNQMDARAPDFDGELLFPVETTFDEWLYSEFALTGVYAPQFAGAKPDGIVRTCQDCHMPRAVGTAADAAFNPLTRDCQTSGCLPVHTFVGGNTWAPLLLQNPAWGLNAAGESAALNATIAAAEDLLGKAATLAVTLSDGGANKLAAVRVTNQSGHKLPTGYPEGRQMWLNVKAYNANETLIYESGAYNPQSGTLTRDTDIKVYETKQGLTPELAALLPYPAGETFHFVLNNTVVKDNRIPPRGYTQAQYDRPGLRPVGATFADGQHWDDTQYTLPGATARVLVTLYYQTASKEYIDFLQQNGGVDGLALGDLWENSKSPPVVMAQAWSPSFDVYLPLVAVDGAAQADTWGEALGSLLLFAAVSLVGGLRQRR